jgi:hypothetical protein
MIDVSDIEGKFTIIFLAQTGMRPEDALKLTVGDVQRELALNRCPLAISYLPQKDRNRNIGERITFLGKDGVEVLKQYLEWRKRNGETINHESPLFRSRSRRYDRREVKGLTKHMMNKRVQEAAKKAGIGNNNGKYGRVRAYCLRKFFVTQLTNHGVQDKVVNFFIGHKVPPVDLAYWIRRVEELREIYRQREKYLNPISGTRSEPSSEEIDIKIDEKIKGLLKSPELKKYVYNIIQELIQRNKNEISYKSVIVTTEDEVLKLSNQGYDCQALGNGKWLMRRPIKVKFNLH